MPLGLAQPHDGAEDVLNPQGEIHHGVGFKLGQINHHIRFNGILGDLNGAEGRADIHLYGFLEGLQVHIQILYWEIALSLLA